MPTLIVFTCPLQPVPPTPGHPGPGHPWLGHPWPEGGGHGGHGAWPAGGSGAARRRGARCQCDPDRRPINTRSSYGAEVEDRGGPPAGLGHAEPGEPPHHPGGHHPVAPGGHPATFVRCPHVARWRPGTPGNWFGGALHRAQLQLCQWQISVAACTHLIVSPSAAGFLFGTTAVCRCLLSCVAEDTCTTSPADSPFHHFPPWPGPVPPAPLKLWRNRTECPVLRDKQAGCTGPSLATNVSGPIQAIRSHPNI